jgi:negative regulator of genetic competence, sporulation and motility
MTACCPDCGKSFASAGPLAQHIQAKHPNVCIVCNKSFGSEISLNQHTVDTHGTGNIFHFTAVRNQNSHSACCPDCGKSFASAGPLAQHIQAKHANVCIVCNKSFRSESSLNQHTVDKHGTGTSFTLLQSGTKTTTTTTLLFMEPVATTGSISGASQEGKVLVGLCIKRKAK